MDKSKRALFRRHVSTSHRIAMPWQIEDDLFFDGCTRCGKCNDACGEGIVVKGDGGFPTIDFKNNGCTFCYDCADACPEHLFLDRALAPWEQVAEISKVCLAFNHVECRSCSDSCDEDAIKFELKISDAAQPTIQTEKCSGCGACVEVCPTQAIKIIQLQEQ